LLAAESSVLIASKIKVCNFKTHGCGRPSVALCRQRDFLDHEAFKRFEFKNVVSIDARFTDDGNNPLLAQALDPGGWL
jgi:hypothetical protein